LLPKAGFLQPIFIIPGLLLSKMKMLDNQPVYSY
jgi:hypothetical protein